MNEEEVGGRELALACSRQAATNLAGVVERNGRLGVQGRTELLAEVKEFFFGKYKGVCSFACCCKAADLNPIALCKRIADYLGGAPPEDNSRFADRPPRKSVLTYPEQAIQPRLFSLCGTRAWNLGEKRCYAATEKDRNGGSGIILFNRRQSECGAPATSSRSSRAGKYDGLDTPETSGMMRDGSGIKFRCQTQSGLDRTWPDNGMRPVSDQIAKT